MEKLIGAQGFQIDINVIYQDFKSCIKLAEKGKDSSGKRAWHFDIKYFYIMDLIKRQEVSIEYYSSNEILADDYTKPIISKKFTIIRNKIMNHA